MAQSPKDLRKKYLARPPVEPMHLRPGMSVEELVDVYRRAGAFNGGRLAEGWVEADVMGMFQQLGIAPGG